MNPSSGLVDELPEVFERFGPVQVRRMFGGYGIFHDGRMFGLVAGGRLYLKTDDENRAQFVDKKLAPFEYMRSNELTATSYYEAPAEIYEDRDEAARWARLAWDAVLRKGSAAARKPRKLGAKNAAAKKPATKKAAAKKSAGARGRA